MTDDEIAYQKMQQKLADDLEGINGEEAQMQAILDEVDAMLDAQFGALSITGGADTQATQDTAGFNIFTNPA